MRWERAEQGKEAVSGGGGPGKRWGHTCNAIKGGRFLYVFGGYGQDNCQTNLVHVFDSVKQTWSQPTVKGSPPTPRDSHSCTTVGDNLFVFGGTDGRSPLKDLHILDTSSHTWISPSIRGEGPEAREGHSATLVGKRLFIFGGCGKSSDDEEVYYNDLYILNTETFVWKKAVTTGTPPSARDSHTCSTWKNKIFVIGGEDGRDYYLSDVHILDTDTLMWKQLNTSGHMLPPRAGHATVSFGKILFVFGGFTEAQSIYDDLHMLDVETGLWTKVSTTGDGPSARFSVAGDSLDPVKAGVLVFIGGLVREHERRLEKLSLRKQLKLKCQEQNPTLGHDKAIINVGVNAGICQPMPLSIYGQPGASSFSPNFSEPVQAKKMFHAKVTELLSEGYSIETVIDGKPLRGVVFSNKPSAFHLSHQSSSRKRTFSEINPVTSHGDHSNKMSTPRTVPPQDSVEQSRADHTQEKTSTSQEPAPEVVAAPSPAPKIAETSGASAADKFPATEEPSATPLDSKDNRDNDAPTSNLEVPEERLPASTRSPTNSSPKLGDGTVIEDKREDKHEDKREDKHEDEREDPAILG
ncbi:hypothetical protein CDL15_Pgr008808 [Punica granatum]|uniref:Attractin/MKLN-like beta-propeller domain-containing protein n=1 Tax=Punica granatum TaxID=22663 RepID=A0A218VY60_PUNGR|nr:hypothetical protein CDL15_Pgr008808 [Punica granatum]